MSDIILEVNSIKKEFPGVVALDNVNIKIKRGEVHALVGENGAGKSTLMKILSGVYSQTSGEIIYEGQRVEFTDPKEAQAKGISIIHQEFSLVPYLNSFENIFLGRELKKWNTVLDKAAMRKRTNELLNQLNAKIDPSVPVSRLSIANQQFIEIAKAISIETKILIFDEPTASLIGEDIERLFELIERLKANGVTIIYISHHLDEILHICDSLTCLRDGVWIDTKKVNDVTKQDIIKMMVGREVNNAFPEKNQIENSNKNRLLEVKSLSNDYIDDVSFYLNRGEILGIAGVVGAGRTETVRALIGADPTTKKEVYINNSLVSIKSPTQALEYGISLIPESRKTQGLVLGMTVARNITLPNLKDLQNNIRLIDRKKELEVVNTSIKNLRIKTPNAQQTVRYLSGGNQQKVVLAKWLNTECEILIFDEPTRGIDIGAKEEIYKIMRELTKKGISIIMISSELPEILGMSDRVLVMYKGSIRAELIGDEATQEKVMYYATGGVDNE